MPDSISDEEKPMLHRVRVGLPGGNVHHLELDIDAQLSNVAEQVVLAEHLDPSAVRVRLISAGRLHHDQTQLVKDVVPDGGFIHCAISDVSAQRHAAEPAEHRHARNHDDPQHHHSDSQSDGALEGAQPHSQFSSREHHNPSQPRQPGHGRHLTRQPDIRIPLEAYNINGEVRIVIPNFNTHGAHERLRQAGFTSEEIRLIRRHMRALHREARLRPETTLIDMLEGSDVITPTEQSTAQQGDANNDSNDGDEINRSQRANQSDENGTPHIPHVTHSVTFRPRGYIRNQIFTSGVEGSNGDFLMGCIFGYLLGVIVLVLLLDNSATRRWRIGIVAGVATNCAFGILRNSVDTTHFQTLS